MFTGGTGSGYGLVEGGEGLIKNIVSQFIFILHFVLLVLVPF